MSNGDLGHQGFLPEAPSRALPRAGSSASGSGKNSRTLSRIRHLCASNLRSEHVLPSLIPELDRLVPFEKFAFSWSNARGELVNCLGSPFRLKTIKYLREHWAQLEADAGFTTVESMREFPEVCNPRSSGRMRADYDDTQTYQHVWRMESIHFMLLVIVRASDGRPLAQIQLFRPRTHRDFDLADERAIAAALPYLRRLLEGDARALAKPPMVPDPNVGVAVLTPDQEVIYTSPRATAICVRAFNDRLPVTEGVLGLRIQHPIHALREMMKLVVFEARPNFSDSTDSLVAANRPGASIHRSISNSWGHFQFDWQFRQASRRGEAVWGVAIREFVPLSLRVLAELEDRDLSDRQRDIACRLVEGVPTADIAEALGVGRETLRDHLREIYRKVGVQNRDELLRRVLGAQFHGTHDVR